MRSDSVDEVLEAKRRLREESRARRQAQPDKDAVSRLICAKLTALPAYAASRRVMLYLGFGDEIRTRPLVQEALDEGKSVVVPYCQAGVLELYLLQGMDELAPGTWGILEPKRELRLRGDRRVAAEELDLILVPGLAFDPDGGRLGYGKGYYDKLLSAARPGAPLVAAAFACQVFPKIPMLPHDVAVDVVVTETSVYGAGN